MQKVFDKTQSMSSWQENVHHPGPQVTCRAKSQMEAHKPVKHSSWNIYTESCRRHGLPGLCSTAEGKRSDEIMVHCLPNKLPHLPRLLPQNHWQESLATAQWPGSTTRSLTAWSSQSKPCISGFWICDKKSLFFQVNVVELGTKRKTYCTETVLTVQHFLVAVKQDLNTMPGPDPWARHALTTCRKPGWSTCIMSYLFPQWKSFHTRKGEDAYQIWGSEMSSEKTIIV